MTFKLNKAKTVLKNIFNLFILSSLYIIDIYSLKNKIPK